MKCCFYFSVEAAPDPSKPAPPPDVLSGQEEPTARRILTNCLTLLDREKYPQIASSASYLLADIYIPDELNPLQEFNGTVVQNTETKESKKKKKKIRKRIQRRNESKPKIKPKPEAKPEGESVRLDDLRNQDMQQNPRHPPVEPMPEDLESRCFEGTTYSNENLVSNF